MHLEIFFLNAAFQLLDVINILIKYAIQNEIRKILLLH